MQASVTEIRTAEEIDELITEVETRLDDIKRVRTWMANQGRRAIELKYWPSIQRARTALKTGVRGLMDARR